MRIAVYVDVASMFFSVSDKFKRSLLDYRKYREFIADIGDVTICKAFFIKKDGSGDKFASTLEDLGYEVLTKEVQEMRRCMWDAGMVVEIMSDVDEYDTVILGTCNDSLVPLVQWLRAKGKQVIVFATQIDMDLAQAANKTIEIFDKLVRKNG